jgi:nicotinamide mononucleotide (NMN) deamidase PncC
MAEGAVRRTGARLGVAITGIAGPDGGTPDKPVGTVCFGLWCDEQPRAWTLAMGPFGRTFIRERSVLEALVAMLRASDTGANTP